MNNLILKSFLEQEHISELYLDYISQPSQEKKEKIEFLFQKHMKKIQLIGYYSKVLKYEAQRFDRKTRHSKQTQIAASDILEYGENSLKTTYNENFYFEKDINDFQQLENIFEDERISKIISNLTDKKKKILFLIYVKELKESEVAKLLNISKQAVNKLKKRTIQEIKNEYI